ncbi:MAG: YkgJ family cysteine cluster protein [Paucibacter sp.]|nr:YkgJ family cysteine cluster protein [Roseateles sp.]
MQCRPHCAACCIAPSISSPIPGMPLVNGISKPAGVRCIQLDEQDRCKLFGRPERPTVCGSLQPSADMCGDSREQAMLWLSGLDAATRPGC